MADVDSVTLGGKPCQVVPALRANINVFFSHTGANRRGRGLFAMFRSDYQVIANQQTVKLSMQSSVGDGIEIDVVVAGAEPLLTTVAGAGQGDSPDDLMRVAVTDTRRLMLKGTTRAYNVMSEPFRYDTEKKRLAVWPSTLKYANKTSDGVLFSWKDIQSDLSDIGCPKIEDPPKWYPYNVFWNDAPAATIIDDFLGRLYLIVGWDIAKNVFTSNKPGEMNAANTALLKKANAELPTAGGIGERNPFGAVGQLAVGFATWNADNPSNPYGAAQNGNDKYTSSYVKSVKVGNSNPKSQPLDTLEMIGIWQNGDWANLSEMDVIAKDIAPRAYAAMTIDPEQHEFGGIWGFSPDGAIRGIKWEMNGHGFTKTVIRVNNDRDFIDPFGQAVETLANQHRMIQGLGTARVGFEAGTAQRQIFQQPVFFFARITEYSPLREKDPSPRWKYGWKEVSRVCLTEISTSWEDVPGGRKGSINCDYCECSGDGESAEHACRWALSMYEGDNYQAAPTGPTQLGAIVLMFVDYDHDERNGYPRYTFLHAPVSKIGQLVRSGPCQEPDYTKAEYWVQIMDPAASGVNDPLTLGSSSPVPNKCSPSPVCPQPEPFIVTATNTWELAQNTHKLVPVVDDGSPLPYVVVTGVYDLNNPATLHYVFTHAPEKKLTTGTVCFQGSGPPTCEGATKPDTVDVDTDTSKIYFSQNYFAESKSITPKTGDFCAAGEVFYDWMGHTWYGYNQNDDFHCKIRQVWLAHEVVTSDPPITTVTSPTSDSLKIPVFFTLSEDTLAADICNCTGDINPHKLLKVKANVYVPPAPPSQLYFHLCDNTNVGQAGIIKSRYNLNAAVAGGVASLDWTGFTITDAHGLFGEPVNYCRIQVLETGFGQPSAPLFVKPQTIIATTYNSYEGYFSFDTRDDADPCDCDRDNGPRTIADMAVKIYIDPCDFAINIYDCLGISPIGTTTGIRAGTGLDVSIEGGDCPASYANLRVQIASDSTGYLTVDCDGLHITPSVFGIGITDCIASYLPVTSIILQDGLFVVTSAAGSATIGLGFAVDGTVTYGGTNVVTGTYDTSSPCNPVLHLTVDVSTLTGPIGPTGPVGPCPSLTPALTSTIHIATGDPDISIIIGGTDCDPTIEIDLTIPPGPTGGSGGTGATGATGDTGGIGPTGPTGPCPTITAGATIQMTTGASPAISVTVGGTACDPDFQFALTIPCPSITLTSTITTAVGALGLTITPGGTTCAPTFAFAFTFPPSGVSPSTTTFTVPAKGATATLDVADASGYVVGETVFIPGAGSFTITGISGNTLTLLNPGFPNNAAPGVPIAPPIIVVPNAPPNAYTATTADTSANTGSLCPVITYVTNYQGVYQFAASGQVTAVSGGSVVVTATWVDRYSVPQTYTWPTITTLGPFFLGGQIQAAVNSGTVLAICATAAGAITYDIQGSLQQIS